MGIDAQIEVRVSRPYSENELSQMECRFKEATDEKAEYVRLRTHEDDPSLIELCSPERWYDKGYERGNWSRLYAFIRWLQFNFPGCPVYYYADSDDRGEPVTVERLDAIWAHWAKHGGIPYHGAHRGGTQMTYETIPMPLDECPDCKAGTCSGVHMISCPCPKCSPRC